MPATAGATDTAAAPVSQAVLDIADTFVTLIRSAGRARARFVAAAEHDVEWSAQVILRMLASNGPMRASALAGCLHSDPSTVSRQVAALVKDGLVERRADPDDGRASMLVLTAKADGVLAEHVRLRGGEFAAMLADWQPAELSGFAAALRRFAADFESATTRLLADRPDHVTEDQATQERGTH